MKSVWRVSATLALLLSAGCTSGKQAAGTDQSAPSAGRSASPSADRLAALRRPWAQPPVASGQRCPVTTVSSQPDPDLAPLLGQGPARPASFGSSGVLNYLSPRQRPDWVDQTWGGEKVLWAVDPAQRGPVLVRGVRLDAPGSLAFEDPAIAELVLNVEGKEGRGGGWMDYPSFTRLRAPGCYAYQIDTTEGTWSVVFMADGPSV
jgi:hypothetical protein